jgi:transposase
VQVWDIPAITLEKVHYLLPRRRCGCGCGCGKTITAVPPCGAAEDVTDGPKVNAVAILLACRGNVPIERTVILMEALLGVPVPSGSWPASWNGSLSAWTKPGSMRR